MHCINIIHKFDTDTNGASLTSLFSAFVLFTTFFGSCKVLLSQVIYTLAQNFFLYIVYKYKQYAKKKIKIK